MFRMEHVRHYPGSYAKNPLFQPDHQQEDAFQGLGAGEGSVLVRARDVESGLQPWERRHEDALGPLLQSIRSNQGDPISSAFSSQMSKLYHVFRDLYDQDQAEIRQLLVTLETQKLRLQQLSAENASARQQIKRDREQSAAALAAAVASATAAASRDALLPSELASGLAAAPAPRESGAGPPGRRRTNLSQRVRLGSAEQSESEQVFSDPPVPASPSVQKTRRGKGGEGAERMGREAASNSGEARSISPSSSTGKRPYLILFLPYLLHPAHHWWRFYAAWQNSWSTRRTTWLAVAWLLVFLLAVGLLVGLLVPWGDLTSTEFNVEPTVTQTSAYSVNLVMQLNREATVFYAVVPAQYTSGLAPPPSPSKRRRLQAQGNEPVPQPTPGATAVRSAAWPPCLDPLRRWLLWRQYRGQQPADTQLRSTTRRRERRLASAGKALPLLQLGNVEADDLREVAESGADDTELLPYAVACGVVEVSAKDTNYTLSVTGITRPGGPGGDPQSAATAAIGTPEECLVTFGLALNGSLPVSDGRFVARRCQRCPFLWPSTPYIVLVMGDGGRSTGVYKVPFATLSDTNAG